MQIFQYSIKVIWEVEKSTSGFGPRNEESNLQPGNRLETALIKNK